MILIFTERDLDLTNSLRELFKLVIDSKLPKTLLTKKSPSYTICIQEDEWMKSIYILALIFTTLILFSYTDNSVADIYYHKRDFTGKHIYTNKKPKENGYKTFYTSTPVKKPEKTELKTKTTSYSENFDELIDLYSEKYRLDPMLVKAIIKVESNFNPNAVSPKGATGLMQLMPATARRHGVRNIYNVNENISGGTMYFSKLMNMFDYDLKLALAGYNAGENAVIRYNYSIPPYKETQNYVKKVLHHYQALKKDQPAELKIKVARASLPVQKEKIDPKKNFSYKETLEEVGTKFEPKPLAKKIEKKSKIIVQSVEYEQKYQPQAEAQYSVQVASFKEFNEALQMKKKLDQGNEEVFIEKTRLPGKGNWFRVKVGQFHDKDKAQLFAEKLKDNNPNLYSAYVTN